jgi:hypothetical protein
VHWWNEWFETREIIGRQLKRELISLSGWQGEREMNFAMKKKFFARAKLTGEGGMVAHWITNGSDGANAALSPFVKGLADRNVGVTKDLAGVWVMLLWVILACGVCSCSTIGTRTEQYAAVPPQSPTTPNHVKILRSQPAGPYEELGAIVVDGSTEPIPPPEKFEDALKQQAADLGADAVVVVSDRVQPDGLVGDLPPSEYYRVGEYWTRSVETDSGRQIVAVAIKYGSLPMTGRIDPWIR